MTIYKKDTKRIDKRILNKALDMLSDLDSVLKNTLNIDKDVITIKVNNQYRLVYRASTQMVARLLTHNDYNRVISYRYVGNIK